VIFSFGPIHVVDLYFAQKYALVGEVVNHLESVLHLYYAQYPETLDSVRLGPAPGATYKACRMRQRLPTEAEGSVYPTTRPSNSNGTTGTAASLVP